MPEQEEETSSVPRVSRLVRFNRLGHVRYPVAAIIGILLATAGCGGPSGHSLPSASPTVMATTRAQLTGAERPYLRLHAVAQALTVGTSSSISASDATELAAVAADTPHTTDSVSDPVLDELLADEDAALAKVLTACESGHGDQALVTSLDTIRSEVGSRLISDGIRAS